MGRLIRYAIVMFALAVLFGVFSIISRASAQSEQELEFYAQNTARAIQPDWFLKCKPYLGSFTEWALCATEGARKPPCTEATTADEWYTCVNALRPVDPAQPIEVPADKLFEDAAQRHIAESCAACLKVARNRKRQCGWCY